MQITTGIRSALSHPRVYNLLQQVLGGPKSTAEIVRLYIKPGSNDRILDFGCGPGVTQKYLPPTCSVVGYDISDEYIGHAQHSDKKHLQFTTDLGKVRGEGPYDIVMAMGLLHHLDDSEALSSLSFMYENLKPGGRLVTLDNVFLEDQNPIARWLIKSDRGQNVRRFDDYERLFTHLPEAPSLTVRHDLLRIPYTHVICELVKSK